MLTYVNQSPLPALYSWSPRFESWLGYLCSELVFNAVFLDYVHEIKQLTLRGKALYLYTAGTWIKTTPNAKNSLKTSTRITKLNSSLNYCRLTRRRR
jgi:hypothetical protein